MPSRCMNSQMPAITFNAVCGSQKFAVPTATAVAPAIMNSMASAATRAAVALLTKTLS